MNQVEHTDKLKNLNRRNREFYEQADTIYQEMVRTCPPDLLTADRVLEFQSEAAGIIQREREFAVSPLRDVLQRLGRPLPKFNSPDKLAIALALLQDHGASDLAICDAVDDAREVQSLDADAPLLADEYRNQKTRRNVHTRISKVRRALREKGFPV
jgi:hypothetical protein